MSAQVTTSVAPTGGALALKRSAVPHLAGRLMYEAEVLRAARHPGVVELVACEEDRDGVVTLATEFVGMHSVDTIGPVCTERAAALVAATAITLADLHEKGLVHGRIEPSHILIGSGGRPVLCGWSGGGEAGTIPPASTPVPYDFRDPARAAGGPLIASVDVFGLGAVLRTLILEGRADFEPIPERRLRWRRWRTPWTGYRRRALLTIADHATDDEPTRRPPARRLAAAIREIVPEIAVDTDDDPFARLRPQDDPPETKRRVPPAVIAGAAIALVVGAWWWTRQDGIPASATSATPSAPAVLSVLPSECPDIVEPAVDVDGDGCREQLRIRNDGVIGAGKRRFGVVDSSARVTVGDFDCNGSASVAVLQPSTGQVFLIDDWTSNGNGVPASTSASVQGAVDFADRDPKVCGPLSMRMADGTERVVVS